MLIRGQRIYSVSKPLLSMRESEGRKEFWSPLAKSQMAIGFLRNSGADTNQEAFAHLGSSTVDQYVQYFDPIKPNYEPKCFSVVRNPKESIDC